MSDWVGTQAVTKPLEEKSVRSSFQKETLRGQTLEEREEEARKEIRKKTIVRAVIAVAIIVVGVFLTLLLISWAAQFESIGSMLEHMGKELQLMGERIFRGSYPRGPEWGV